MTDCQESVAPATWVAIDIAKDMHVVLLETASGEHRSFRVANQRTDFDRFVTLLHAEAQPVRVALEPTGNYHRVLAYRLVTEGFEVCLISSVASARYREARFNSWDKNDPKDAAVLLALLKHGLTQRYVDPLIANVHELQELSKTYFQMALARMRVQHSILTHYLPVYFPEIGKFWQTNRTEWFIRFLLRFPVPAAITTMGEDEFIAIASPVVGRKVHKRELLQEMYAVAQHSIALPIAEHSLAVHTFRVQLQHFLQLEAQRTALEVESETLLGDHPGYQQLRSIPGIGPVFALTILAEAGDIRRFRHHRQFLKYCGLDLAKTQSGTARGRETLSKRGNARLRSTFWFAGRVAVRMRENSFRRKYDRYLTSDPTSADRKRKALTAVAAKMARVVYAVVKTNQPYRCYFERELPSGSIPFSRAVDAAPSVPTS